MIWARWSNAVPVIRYWVFVVLLPPMQFPDTAKLAKTGRRYKLVPFPVIIGAFAALSGEDIPLIKGCIVFGTIVGVARPSDHAIGPCRPGGQSIVDAILLCVDLRPPVALCRAWPSLPQKTHWVARDRAWRRHSGCDARHRGGCRVTGYFVTDRVRGSSRPDHAAPFLPCSAVGTTAAHPDTIHSVRIGQADRSAPCRGQTTWSEKRRADHHWHVSPGGKWGRYVLRSRRRSEPVTGLGST